MKPILLLLGSLVLLVLVFLSGVIITANVIAEPEPHKFANVNTPDLWTSKPKEVDPTKQAYERLPDAPPPQTETASNEGSKLAPTMVQPAPHVAEANMQNPQQNPAVDPTMTASVPPSTMPLVAGNPVQPMQDPNSVNQPVPAQNADVDAAQAQFCYARYRSYRVEDNSYQPFEGGPRRQCQVPGAQQVRAAVPPAASTPVQPSLPAPQVSAVRDTAMESDRAPSHARVHTARAVDADEALPPLPPESIPTDDEWHAIERGDADGEVMESAAPGNSIGSGGGTHEEWCANRYRSYRADDNSYQPFDGSPRRTCQSPFG